QHQHRQAVEGETPYHTESVGLTQDIHIAAACQNGEHLQTHDQIYDPITGAVLFLGRRNQSVRTPSSETRLSTPLDPIIDVLMAPERIRNPTTTTNSRKASFSACGPTMYMAMPAMRLSL